MAREIKRALTKLENLIRTVWYETKKGTVINTDEQGFVVSAIKETLKYYDTYDFVKKENFAQIFKEIYLAAIQKTPHYLASKREKVNVEKISKIKSVAILPNSEPTIKRRCNEIVKVFEKSLNDIKNEKSANGSNLDPLAPR